MQPDKVPAYLLKYDPQRYLDIDFGEGSEEHCGFQRMEFVRLRKPQLCFRGQEWHTVDTVMIKEVGKFDGQIATCYMCIHCAERYIAFYDGDEKQNPHDYTCTKGKHKKGRR